MKNPTWLLTFIVGWFVLAARLGALGEASESPAQARGDEPADLAPVVWLERVVRPAGGAEADRLPLFKVIAREDLRVRDSERLIENEPARFTRRLAAWAWRTFGSSPDWPAARLAIVLEKGGNYARSGFRLLADGGTEAHPTVPYIILEVDAQSLSDTLLHEGGHLLHSIAAHNARPETSWSAIVHTTFAVTDPLTALAEGYAIHFETLLGHYGREPEKQRFYHRVAPAFDLKASRRAEYYAPITDLLTFSQSWARYQAVRDTWPAFAGHVYADNYLRSQFDPARDRSTLKPANAMVASEGVVASVLFWAVAGLADEAGARFGQGLDQRQLFSAEQTLLRALAALPAKSGFRPDLIDLVSAIGEPGSPARKLALSRFVNVTRGVTARPEFRQKWRTLYYGAIGLDLEGTKPMFAELDAARDAIIDAAQADPGTLRRGLGPVLAVRAPKVELEVKALGEKFPLEFDLNSATAAEWLAAGCDRATSEQLLNERDARPFVSVGDFEQRTGRSLASLGLTPVERSEVYR
jgi:hypothetical protein